MRKDQIYPSKYLKAADLRGRDVVVTIENVDQTLLQGKPALVAYFRGKEKGLIVKPAIFDQIEKVTGEDDTENWAGHEITLFPTEADFGGQTFEVIRVRTLKRAAAPRRAAAPPEEPPHVEPEDPSVTDEEDPESILF